LNDFSIHKLTGLNEAPQLYTRDSANLKWAIRQFPLNGQEIPLYFDLGVNTTNCVLQISGIETVTECQNIYLEDVLTGSIMDLSEANTYTFQHNTGANSHRFNLIFDFVTGTPNAETKAATVFSANGKVYLQAGKLTGQQALIEMFNAVGQCFYSKKCNLPELLTLKVDVVGIVLISVQTEAASIVEKVILPHN
jgi:hypothetical protein